LVFTAFTVLNCAGGMRVNVRLPENFTYGSRSDRGRFILISASGGTERRLTAPLKNLFVRPGKPQSHLQNLAMQPGLSLGSTSVLSDFLPKKMPGSGIVLRTSPLSQDAMGLKAKRKARPSPSAW